MSYLRKHRCPECGQPHWFRNWVGQFCARSSDGLYVLDYDLQIHRFKQSKDKLGSRDIEHLMKIEVKVDREKMNGPQQDSLSVFNGLLDTFVPINGSPINVKSRPGFVVPGEKKIIWHGVHLLRVPFAENVLGPFVWDNHPIASDWLIDVINFDRDPRNPSRMLDIERRHKLGRKVDGDLFSTIKSA